jgi:hypothetical protein
MPRRLLVCCCLALSAFAQDKPPVPFDAVLACVTVQKCANMKASGIHWFDQVNIPVVTFKDGDYAYALRASRDGISIWITPPNWSRPEGLVTIGSDEKVVSGELGPQPGDRGPQRMTPQEFEQWRKVHRVFSTRGPGGDVWGEENRAYWQGEADRALAAIRRQLAK